MACSSLLALPRELRDIIYDILVHYDAPIPVECAVASASELLPAGVLTSIKDVFPLWRPVSSRATWPIPVSVIADYTTAAEVQMTYQKAVQYDDPTNGVFDSQVPHIDLQVMLVCKQVYMEACEVFYTRNTFSFLSEFRIPTAFHFLRDRPALSSHHLRSLEIRLTEDYFSGRLWGPPGPNRIAGDGKELGIAFSYGYYTQLCQLLSSTDMQLRKLNLWIETLCHHHSPSVENPLSLRDCLSCEADIKTPWPSWLAALLKMTNLEKVALIFSSSYPMLRRCADITTAVRENTLKRVNPVVAPSESTFLDFKSRFQYRGVALEYPEGTDFLIRFDASENSFAWRACTLRNYHLTYDITGEEGGVCMYRPQAGLLDRSIWDVSMVCELST